MAIILDSRGNEFLGSLDQITGQTITDARAATASLGALNAETLMDLNGKATVTVDLRSAAFTGTVVFEGTLDGTNYIALPALNIATQAYVALLAGAGVVNSQLLINTSGFRRIRVRVSLYTSGALNVAMRGTTADSTIQVERIPMTLSVTATAATAAIVTLSLPLLADMYHYIDSITVSMFTGAAIAAAGAAPTIVTTTNIPGTPSLNFRNDIQPAGQLTVQTLDFNAPMRSTAAGTATTVVCPATVGILWKATAIYRIGY